MVSVLPKNTVAECFGNSTFTPFESLDMVIAVDAGLYTPAENGTPAIPSLKATDPIFLHPNAIIVLEVLIFY